ncbi:MAG: SDR family oxidoreductase [Bdellovibrionota bacterium]
MTNPAGEKVILVTGAGGMAGRAIMDVLGRRHICIGLSGQSCPPGIRSDRWKRLNILDDTELAGVVQETRPDAIVHAASSVFVNECERPSEREKIYDLHVRLTRSLVEHSRQQEASLVYISTESVYDGAKHGLYIESDATRPLNYYAQTKLEGEYEVREWSKGLTLRTNILGWRTDGRMSFMEWVLDGLKKCERRTMLTDVTFSPVSTYHLADDIGACIEREISGLYHAGGATSVSKFDLARKLALKLDLDSSVLTPVTMDQIKMGAARPKNTSLDSSKLASILGKPRPTIDESIDRFLARR